MFLSALKIKLIALVSVAGLNTDDMPELSKDMSDVLVQLAADQQDEAKDNNAAFNEAVAKVRELAQNGDKDALYTLAHWFLQSGAQNVPQIVDLYSKASEKGQILAKVELAQVLLKAYSQEAARVEEAIDLLTEAEQVGNSGARRILAQLHLAGAGKLEKSVEKAKDLLVKASESGDGAATLDLSQLYQAGVEGLPRDDAKSLEYLKQASAQGNAEAMAAYGARLFNGDTATKDRKPLVEKDPKAAMEMLSKAADKGFAAANRLLGEIYEQGLGGNEQDVEKGMQYMSKAANGNDAQALYKLGVYSQVGLGTKDGDKTKVVIAPNPKNALDLFRQAAQNGLPQAYLQVGTYYESGTVVDKDLEKAFQFYLQAANAGIPEAQHKLGEFYQNGGGISQDVVAAAAWYDRASQQNYAPSQIALGSMYELGIGVRQQPTAAAQQYSNAAEQGQPQAMLKLASLYERGIATAKSEPDLPRAWAYCQLAVDASKSAPVAVQFRDLIQKKMSEDQVAEGKKIYDSKKKVAEEAPSEGDKPKAE